MSALAPGHSDRDPNSGNHRQVRLLSLRHAIGDISVQQMGVRSPLVLVKLGFDLRAFYDDVVKTPAPEHLRVLAERLPQQPPLQVVQPVAEPELGLANDDPPLS